MNNNKEKSIFYICLKKNYYEESKIIYEKYKNFQNSFFNPLILNYIITLKKENEFFEFIDNFKDIINFNLFNCEQKRSLLHYICLYISDNIFIFKQLLSHINDIKLDYSLKDKYERNCLFYLFLNEKDKRKKHDPIEQLMHIFEKDKFDNNLNDKDIFGNNLLFYAVQSRAYQCVDFILENGAVISSEQNNNENSIFSVSLLKKEVQLFYYLYDKINDPNVFNHKVYAPYKNDDNNINNGDFELDLDNCEKGETLYNFLTKYNFNNIKKNKKNRIVGNTLYNNNNITNNYNNINYYNNNVINYNNNINNNKIKKNVILNNYNYANNFNNYNNINLKNNINNQTQNLIPNNQILNQGINNNNINNNSLYQESLNKTEIYFSDFLSDDILIFINEYINNITIKKNNVNNNNINENYIKLKENNIIINFSKNIDEYIFDRINKKRKIVSQNLVIYCIANNYEDFIRFSFNEKYNPISICQGLILFNKFSELKNYFLRILSQNNNEQNKLQNLIDDKGKTIYHLLPFLENNLYICKKLEKHNISNIFDNEGHTPMFYACKYLNKNFIEKFSHYQFNSNEQKSNDVNYDLFLEAKNNKMPLEMLYEFINKKDDRALKLIIDIGLNTKKIIFVPLIKYLIQEYNSNDNKIYKLDYQTNLNSGSYLHKLIGLYQFYTRELKENIMIKDENGNDPFFICAENNKFDFIFDILIKEPNICLNSTNSEGKSIIHLILEKYENKSRYKNELLIKALKSGFEFNIKDKDGMLPIDYAIKKGNNEIINILKEYYTNLSIDIEEKINNINTISSINNQIDNKINIDYDYNKDSDTFYNESITVSMSIDKNENLNGLVSQKFKYDKILSFYQVCIDDESSIPLSVNLVKKDFENVYNYEYNDKKYCIQVIKDVNKDNEYLTIAVDNSDVKSFTFRDLNTAKKKFKDLFKEMTANDWDNVKYNKLNFKTDYKKYYIFDSSYEEENAIYEYLKITIKNLYIKQKSEYEDKNIKNLIYYLLVKSYQNKFSIDGSTLNVEENTKNILKRYKSTALIKAMTILLVLKKLLNSENKVDEKYLRKRNYLINSYNDLIPYSKKINDFDEFSNIGKIDEEISRLTNYYYIDNVLKIFLGAIYNLNNIHPLDYFIKVLDCKIKQLPKPKPNLNELTTETDYIYNYIFSTNWRNSPITAVYKITKSNNEKNFNLNKYNNRYLFFHGTKAENVIGILSQGLKIAPVQAINTGKSYGNGIYLSDNFSYSLGYCYHRIYNANNMNFTDEKIFVFIVEVAVGKIGNYNDTHIVNMTMDFNDYYTAEDGSRIFKNSKKINNGFGIIVAHEETNVRIKYLIEIN